MTRTNRQIDSTVPEAPRSSPPAGRPSPSPHLARTRAWALGVAAWTLAASACGFGGKDDAAAAGGASVGDANANTSAGGAGTGTSPAGGAGTGNGATGNVGNLPGPAVAPGAAGLAVVPISGCVPAEYFGAVNFGDDHLSLLLDSGSTTTAVASTACSGCNVSEAYDGSTGTNLRRSANAEYGDGSAWSGTLWRDGVDMGALAAPLTPEVQVAFAAVTAEANNFFSGAESCQKNESIGFDGILGLGPDTLLASGSTSFLTALAATGKLANDAFSTQFCEVGGNVMLGGYASNTVASAPFFVPMLSSQGQLYYYSMAVSGVSLGGVDTQATSKQLGPAIVDSGTQIVVMPASPFRALLQVLGANAAFNRYMDLETFESGACMQPREAINRDALDAALPKLQLRLTQTDGTPATLELDASRSYLVPLLDATGGVHYCGAVREGDDGDPFILGNPVMRQHVVIYDRANKRLGFAPQQGCDPTPAYGGT